MHKQKFDVHEKVQNEKQTKRMKMNMTWKRGMQKAREGVRKSLGAEAVW